MTPFLRQVAEICYKNYASEISDYTFVFQSRRAAKFFQKYLGEAAGVTLFSPNLITVGDFIRQESDLLVADRLFLLLKIYDIYKAILKTDESFDEFAYWGEMLLGDFDDADKYLVNVKELFSNLKDLKEIENHFDYLDEKQKDAILTFWGHWKGEKQGEKNFISVWEHLYDIYRTLNDELRKENLAYEGMVYREVAERMKKGETLFANYNKIIFVGLNALTECEYEIYSHLKNTHDVDFYWDYASPDTKDPSNRASHFRDRNILKFPTKLRLDDEPCEIKHVHIIEMSSTVGQAKHIGEILEGMDMKAISNQLSTAVVLPDEELLLPLLHSIPREISNVNITMGYPLSKTPLNSLIENLFSLHLNQRPNKGFYFRDAITILSHQYISELSAQASVLLNKIYKENIIYIDRFETDDELIKTIFASAGASASDFIDYLLGILALLRPDTSKATEHEKMKREFIYHYYITLKRLKDLLRNTEMSKKTLLRFVRQFISSVSVPFEGEPLKGLQIMGVLETRNLDFDTLIIPCMNEGIFPKINAGNSYVPYNLRYGFGMPTGEHIDSVYAYHFYRLIFRARNIYFLYNSSAEGLQTGEESRYIMQLRYSKNSNIEIDSVRITCEISKSGKENITVGKSDDVMQEMSKFLSGERKLSASSICTYIACPLKFYLQNIKMMGDTDEVKEELDAAQFGNVFHDTMQELYRPMIDKEVTADFINRLLIEKDLKTIDRTILESFKKKMKIQSPNFQPEGQPLIALHIVKQFVKGMLNYDKMHTPFVYRASEQKFDDMLIPLSDSARQVHIKGFIDRVDEKDGKTRIIDYKTGKCKMGSGSKLEMADIPSLFDKEADLQKKEIFQILLYSLYYNQYKHTPPENIVPKILFVQDLQKYDAQETNCTNILVQDGRNKEKLLFSNECCNEFRKELVACLDEMFSPEKPFEQTTTEKHCSGCNFKNICERKTFEY